MSNADRRSERSRSACRLVVSGFGRLAGAGQDAKAPQGNASLEPDGTPFAATL